MLFVFFWDIVGKREVNFYVEEKWKMAWGMEIQ